MDAHPHQTILRTAKHGASTQTYRHQPASQARLSGGNKVGSSATGRYESTSPWPADAGSGIVSSPLSGRKKVAPVARLGLPARQNVPSPLERAKENSYRRWSEKSVCPHPVLQKITTSRRTIISVCLSVPIRPVHPNLNGKAPLSCLFRRF
jgi:hypothetical protein